jgi:hypothetical protein
MINQFRGLTCEFHAAISALQLSLSAQLSYVPTAAVLLLRFRVYGGNELGQPADRG